MTPFQQVAQALAASFNIVMILNSQRGNDWAQVSSLKHLSHGKYYDVMSWFFSHLCFSLMDEVVADIQSWSPKAQYETDLCFYSIEDNPLFAEWSVKVSEGPDHHLSWSLFFPCQQVLKLLNNCPSLPGSSLKDYKEGKWWEMVGRALFLERSRARRRNRRSIRNRRTKFEGKRKRC